MDRWKAASASASPVGSSLPCASIMVWNACAMRVRSSSVARSAACQAVAPSSAWRISSTSKRYSGSPWNSGRYGASGSSSACRARAAGSAT
ncbi:hypothetical protein G6F68_016699 [Rhizopus microsporus]|nr:hypothetical protein G6F68_016699 [Rhizopus microsporus]